MEPFLFLGAALLAGSSFFRSTAEWLLLGRQFPLILGTLLFSDSSGSVTVSSLGKDFFLLGRVPVPAVSSR